MVRVIQHRITRTLPDSDLKKRVTESGRERQRPLARVVLVSLGFCLLGNYIIAWHSPPPPIPSDEHAAPWSLLTCTKFTNNINTEKTKRSPAVQYDTG